MIDLQLSPLPAPFSSSMWVFFPAPFLFLLSPSLSLSPSPPTHSELLCMRRVERFCFRRQPWKANCSWPRRQSRGSAGAVSASIAGSVFFMAYRLRVQMNSEPGAFYRFSTHKKKKKGNERRRKGGKGKEKALRQREEPRLKQGNGVGFQEGWESVGAGKWRSRP